MDQSQLQLKILDSLNEKQREAVTQPCSGILQIVAGPGTGKTKVIVSRVAYLLLHEGVAPQHIIVTTFTKRAANEMMERLREVFLGTDINVGQLLIGTFHSICFKIIQKYGKLVNLTNFSIADERDSTQILQDVLLSRISAEQWGQIETLPVKDTMPYRSRHSGDNTAKRYDVKKLKRQISNAKSAGMFPHEYNRKMDKNPLVSIIYNAYQDELFANSVLDFDDCLLYCHKIISQFPVLKFIKHTLVDEFQDTNEIQLQLMYQFAKGDMRFPETQHNVTIVGDPDQSIYAFRDAQSINFEKMKDHYTQASTKTCKIITLDENYRSTSDILNICEGVMREQTGRMGKSLVSQHKKSFKPVQAVLGSSEEEAKWIVEQISFLQGLPDQVLSLSDMAILVRSAFQTRAIEKELVKRHIPYFMVRGKAFWDRKEVSVVVDYLRCVANADDKLAILRCVNFPKRGLGPKSISDMETLINKHRTYNMQQPALTTLKQIVSGELKSSLGPKMRSGLKLFLLVIEEATRILSSQYDPQKPHQVDGLAAAFDHLYKNSGVHAEFSDNTDCELNVLEVKSQLLAYVPQPEAELPEFEEKQDSGAVMNADEEENRLTGPMVVKKFLELLSLYETDPGETEQQKQEPKVSISTIHGSKGLEWPVVFVPGLNEGLLPASFAMSDSSLESINEERRCFYVATSRAQALLFITGYIDLFANDGFSRSIPSTSRFMEKVRRHCDSYLPLDTKESLEALYEIRGVQYTHTSFDFKNHWETYQQRSRIYEMAGMRHNGKSTTDGFTSGSESNTPMNVDKSGSDRWSRGWDGSVVHKGSFNQASSLAQQKPKLPSARQAKTGLKAPLYFYKKEGSSGDSEAVAYKNKVAECVSKPVASKEPNRAPAYIPHRPNSKRRLGTR